MPDDPQHEANMPNLPQATNDDSAFYTKLQASPSVNIDAALTKLQETLQADFDAIGPPAVY